MMLPKGYRLLNTPAFRKALAAREPVNLNAPGLQGNKNGPPGPEGNQKGPPGAATIAEALASPTNQPSTAPPATSTPVTTATSTSSLNIPSSSVVIASSTPVISIDLGTSSFPTILSVPSPSQISTSSQPTSSLLGKTATPLIPAATGTVTGSLTIVASSIESLTTPDVSTSSDGFSTSSKYLVSGPLSSMLSDTLLPVKTTLQTTFSYRSSATAIQTGIVYHSPNSTAQSGHSAVMLGQKVGAALGTIAGFAFILTFIILFLKWRGVAIPKVLPNRTWRLSGIRGRSRWRCRSQTPDGMSDSLLVAQAGLSDSREWDYQATFARPTVIERARQSLRKSLTGFFRVNPLGLNPAPHQASGQRTLSRKSFTSFLHRRSTVSTRRSLFLQGQSGSVIDPQSPPPLPPHCATLPSPRPSAISGRSIDLAQGDTDVSPQSLKIKAIPQVPAQTLQLPRHYRNSPITIASIESEAAPSSPRSWVKFHYPDRMRSRRRVPQQSGKPLPLLPLPIFSSLWLNAKALRRSHSTTTSEDEKEHHIAGDNGDKSAGTEQALFGLNGRKQVQIGPRISGASADSLVVEKQEI